MLIQRGHPDLSVRRQCELLALNRSSLYYRPGRDAQAVAFEQQVLNAIDVLYTAHPHLGRYGMTDALAQECGIEVNPKRVRRLMKKLGLQAVYPRPRRASAMHCEARSAPLRRRSPGFPGRRSCA